MTSIQLIILPLERVANAAERDALPLARLEEGAVVYVSSETKAYIYLNSTFKELLDGLGIKAKIDTLTTGVATLNTQVGTIQTSVTGLDTRLTALNGALTQIATLQDSASEQQMTLVGMATSLIQTQTILLSRFNPSA
jgi:hypothetical protein